MNNKLLNPGRAHKKDIIPFWKSLPERTPIIPASLVPLDHQGSTLAYDGLRITGSKQFINSILSRTKDILNYDSGGSKLNLIYKQQVDKNTGWPLANSFVFYVQMQEKGKEHGLSTTP